MPSEVVWMTASASLLEQSALGSWKSFSFKMRSESHRSTHVFRRTFIEWKVQAQGHRFQSQEGEDPSISNRGHEMTRKHLQAMIL